MPWEPHPGPQTDFCTAWQDEVLFGGAAGPGKTDCLIMEATRHVNLANYHGLLARRTFPKLQEVIDRTRKWYPTIQGEYVASEKRWYFPSGAKITMGHCQHDGSEYDYQGKEFQYIGLDEAGQFLPKQILYLFSRCRSTDSMIPKRIRYASNPGGPAHQFLKDRFQIGQYPGGYHTFEEHVLVELVPGMTIDEKIHRVFIPGRIADNPSLVNNDPTYIARLMQLPEIERMRLMDGRWDAFEGQVFAELNEDLHGCPPFDIPTDWEVFRSFDWGYAKPWICIYWAHDYNGVLWIFHILVGAKKDERGKYLDVGVRQSDAEIARQIRAYDATLTAKGLKVRPGPADPSIWSNKPGKQGVQGPSTAEEMQREGIGWLRADNDRLAGKRQMHARLRVDEEGMPKMRVFTGESCSVFWDTIPQLREDPKHPEDIDTDQNDHCYDCARYGLMFRPIKPKKIEMRPDQKPGTFAFERKKLLRAREYARRYGTSIESAYNRVR